MSAVPLNDTDANVAAESLSEALDRVYQRLAAVAGAVPADSRASAHKAGPVDATNDATNDVIQRLRTMFSLSAFERDLLVLCFGAAIEARFGAACAAAHGDAQTTWPTFGLALSALEGAHWSATSGSRPLRYWKLVEIAHARGAGSLMHDPLQIDERILHCMLGVPAIDQRLEALVRPLAPAQEAPLEPASARLAALFDEGLRHWLASDDSERPLLLCGERGVARQRVFIELCRRAGLDPYELQPSDLPAAPEDRQMLARLWTREAALQHTALFIRCADDDDLRGLRGWLELVRAPIAIDASAGSPAERLAGLRLDLPALTAPERKAAWVRQLGNAAQQTGATLERIVEYFDFDEASIRKAAASALQTPLDDGDDMGKVVWSVCRRQGRRSLDHLARRIEPDAAWADLVLPDAQMQTLRQIAIHMRQRAVVHQQWGFAERYSRGHGLSALFAGGSGTGKTMAAEILARELDLDLYQIDLASMVSKYIGETEKNLRRVFDAAEDSGTVLLFDECDALFGKRSEVRDSHDRYANLEVSYLLQRMDSYRGVAILTTNMHHALDSAFLRRIRFVVQFPFPDAPLRLRIWQGIFPPRAPLDALDFSQLAQLNVPGGVIRNIATHAAFLAAEEGRKIGTRHILAASRIEYAKMDKPLTAAETRGWL